MSTKSAHEELREWADNNPIGATDLIRRAIAEHEAVKERASGAEHESEMWEEHMQEFTDNESDEAPWITIQNEFRSLREERDQLKSKLTAYEKQWTDMHETICKFQEENTKLKKQLQDAQLPTTEHVQAIYEITQLKAALDASENTVDEQWLDSISANWKALTGKFWETRDGECREAGVQANISALFQYIEDQQEKLDASERRGAKLKEACAELFRQWEKPQPTWPLASLIAKIKEALDS